jgi:hypothetical protein
MSKIWQILHWYDKVLNRGAFNNELVLEVVDTVRFTSYTSDRRTTDSQFIVTETHEYGVDTLEVTPFM